MLGEAFGGSASLVDVWPHGHRVSGAARVIIGNRSPTRNQVGRRGLLRHHGRGGFRTCDLSRVKRALSH
jgi:hypothetical protein